MNFQHYNQIKNSVCLLLIVFTFSILFSCSENFPDKKKSEIDTKVTVAPDITSEKKKTLTFKALTGRWGLKYRGGYGYEFRLYANYRAVVIVFLHSQSIIFKGIYTIVDKNRLKINIYAIKQTRRIRGFNVHHGFVKSNSSYFLFTGVRKKKQKKIFLILRSEKIIIDGSNSDGYFEPVIKLKRF